MTSKRCEGITGVGTRCKRPGRKALKRNIKEYFYCTTHYIREERKLRKRRAKRGYKVQVR